MANIFEKEVHNQFYKYLLDDNLLHSSKHGFHKKRSTQATFIKVVDDWLSNTDDGQVTAVIFLDLAKAFNTVMYQSNRSLNIPPGHTLGI